MTSKDAFGVRENTDSGGFCERGVSSHSTDSGRAAPGVVPLVVTGVIKVRFLFVL